MIRVGINGFGRIGKAIFRINEQKKVLDIVAINDINPDIENIAYQINYETLYGGVCDKYSVDGDCIKNSRDKIRVFCKPDIDQPDWASLNLDVLIDSSGVHKNVLLARKTLEKHSLKRIFITHSPEEVDFTLVLGANEDKLAPVNHRVIASSICDATAIAPVLKVVHDEYGIQNGYITTLHPWLNYQNLMDGSASSWSRPGEIYHHYALGRSMIGNLIPKPTSAIEATCKVLEGVTTGMIGSFSYRTPLSIVGSADITLNLKKNVSKDSVIRLFESLEAGQSLNLFHNNLEPLVSSDFKGSDFSAIIDHRWTDVIDGRLLKLILWYDNEWGYSSRVIDQILFTN